MKQSIQLAGSRPAYFAGLLVFIAATGLLLGLNGKADAFLALNQFHPFWLNVFFINYTFMGDGIFAICLILFLFYLKRKQEAFAQIYAFLLSGLMVQIIKNLVSAPRPRLFFEPGRYHYFLDQVSLANNSSFPSGHTATAFAIATVFVIMLRDAKWQLPVLLAAILVGYSRIYLAQHFVLDVLIGSLIGGFSGVLAIYLSLNRAAFGISLKKLVKPGRVSSSVSGTTTVIPTAA